MPDLLDEVAQRWNKKVQKDRGGRYVKIPNGPTHSDDDDGLKVRLNKKGDDFIVTSFNGNKEEWAERKDWLREELGKPAWLRGKKNGNGKNGNGKSEGVKTLVAEYIYPNELNQPYLKVKKFVGGLGKNGKPKKDYYQEHWDGKGWLTGKPAGPKIPFNLPKILNTPPETQIYFCEGEKDATNLGEISFVATTASEGAQAAWDPALTPYFEGRDVIILPHADAPGRNHAVKVARNIFQVAKSIKILDLYPDRDDGYDVSNFREHDKAGVELVKRVKATPEWTPDIEKRKEDELIGELSELTGIDQVRRKKEIAKHLGISPKELEKVVSEKDTTTQPEHWAVEPWPEPVSTEALLNRLEEVYTAHVILPEYGAITMALWCLHTWSFDAAFATAFLHFISPVPECGKTRAMEALLWTAQRGEMSSNISPSAIFRYIDRCRPTLILDEAETYTKREDVRGILDGSHARAGAYTIRNVGDDHEPRRFSTWGPKVIGGLHKLAATILSRCITLHMKRKRKSEKVIKLRGRDTDAFKALRSQARRWADDNIATLKEAQPVLPDGLTDRGEDCWEPMLAIAELAGPGWIAKAHAAALALSGHGRCDLQDDKLGLQLLAAIKDQIEALKQTTSDTHLSSKVIVDNLLLDETGPWRAFGKAQKEITSAQVAALLEPYEIKPGRRRVGGAPSRSYEFATFNDAFEAYLPDPPSLPGTPGTALYSKDNPQFLPGTESDAVPGKKSEKPNNNSPVPGVPGKKEGETPLRMICAHCGLSDGDILICASGGVEVHLHRACLTHWKPPS
jgi:putative DNA primase/helicase